MKAEFLNLLVKFTMTIVVVMATFSLIGAMNL